MGKYFGTDGFRGEANKDLTVEHAYKVGSCYWERYKKKFLYVRICTCCWTYSKWC